MISMDLWYENGFIHYESGFSLLEFYRSLFIHEIDNDSIFFPNRIIEILIMNSWLISTWGFFSCIALLSTILKRIYKINFYGLLYVILKNFGYWPHFIVVWKLKKYFNFIVPYVLYNWVKYFILYLRLAPIMIFYVWIHCE